MSNTLNYYYSKRRVFVLIFFPLIPLFGGYSLLSYTQPGFKILGVLNLVFGIMGISAGFLVLFDNRSQLTLTPSKIKHRKIIKTPIQWSEIAEAEIDTGWGQKNLILKPKNKLKPERFRYLFRKTAKAQFEKNEFKINLRQLNIDYSELQDFLNTKNLSTFKSQQGVNESNLIE